MKHSESFGKGQNRKPKSHNYYCSKVSSNRKAAGISHCSLPMSQDGHTSFSSYQGKGEISVFGGLISSHVLFRYKLVKFQVIF